MNLSVEMYDSYSLEMKHRSERLINNIVCREAKMMAQIRTKLFSSLQHSYFISYISDEN